MLTIIILILIIKINNKINLLNDRLEISMNYIIKQNMINKKDDEE